MLNYLGPQVGPSGPITSMLPPATPGTMTSAVPGIAQTPAPLPPARFHAPTPIHNRGNGHTPASALAAIMRHAADPGGPLAPQPPQNQFKAVTQADGSVLLHIANPNGTLGPVVKVIPPIKVAGTR